MAAGMEVFRSQIRPLLTDRCVKCHGGEKTRGGLDLTARESALKGGDNGVVLTPGKGRESRLYQLAAHLADPKMPPSGDPLNAAQLANLQRWIDLGAPYDKPLLDRSPGGKKVMIVTAEDRNFWSFRPLSRPALPATKTAWGNNALDRFVLAKLEANHLMPTAEADRRSLIRRVTFDVLGLPPTPEEVEAFVKNPDPLAYEKLVDRLLASPHFGERWARHWLDLVRFAESHGFEHDYDRPTAYHYRDFVIKALNQDVPYDTFVRWQLAGDEIAPENPLAMTATGFLAAGVHSTQITINQVEKERYDELDDIVRTTGTAFLGLTVGCARCHDHKFDPIPTRDYYRMLSTFTTTVRSETDVEPDLDSARVARAAYEKEHSRLQVEALKYEKEQLPGKLTAWLKEHRTGKSSTPWVLLDGVSAGSEAGATLTRLDDGSFLAGGENPQFDTYTFASHTKLKSITALRVEALTDPSMKKNGPGRAMNGNFALSDVRVDWLDPDKPPTHSVKLTAARATFEQKGLPVAAAIDGNPASSWAVDPEIGKSHAAVFEFAAPISGTDEGVTIMVRLAFKGNHGHNIGRPRLSITNAPLTELRGDLRSTPLPAIVATILARAGNPTADEQTALLAWFRGVDPGMSALTKKLKDHVTAGQSVGKVKALICSEGVTPIRLHSQGADFLKETHFLERGDPNQKKAVATPSYLQVLMTSGDEKRWHENPPTGAHTSYQRRSLANWITDVNGGAGHLLARVIVNRLWQHHMGRGIVATPSDFGFQGERPTHPELLDYLASELIQGGWKLKPIHKQILLSATYRQGALADKVKVAVDPDNRWLWRHTPRRMEAEVIRDSLLSVSGLLDPKMYGPGTLDRKMKRRSIYFFVKRSQLIPMMMLFDAPDGLQGIESRATTTIAPQALLLMNSELVRESARALAGRLEGAAKKSTAETVKAGYALALGRSPTEKELTETAAFLDAQAKAYRDEGRTDAELSARIDFCQVLLGLNEFIYVD
jgi:Protein of unknown function (DUF1549)/Protein of unknown function (DUF1553)/Planctomycete cytochrome C